jgi:hypothetical protein
MSEDDPSLDDTNKTLEGFPFGAWKLSTPG